MDSIVLRHLGMEAYEATLAAQRDFTEGRQPDTADEVWLLQHPPVYTLGQAGKPEHLLQASSIPLVKIDRGGQITYHGPGQVVVYTLLDLRRSRLGVRELVRRLEQSVIDLCAEYGIEAYGREEAPGVYVAGAKVASLGLRIRHGCSYHGLALNVDMDLAPFAAINPCGYPGLQVTQLRDLGVLDPLPGVALALAEQVLNQVAPGVDVQATHRCWAA